MEEISKVSLVHCPNCQTLLPQILDYSVYRCAGCGAVLQEKKGNLEGVKGLERTCDENVGVVSDKSENLSRKSDDLVGKGRISGVENGDGRVSSRESSVVDTIVERFVNDSKTDVSNRDFEVEVVDLVESELGSVNLSSKVNTLVAHVDNAYGLRKTSRVFERNLGDIREDERFEVKQSYFVDMRCSSSDYAGEGQSKHYVESNYKREAVEDVELDREELLRKLEDLKDQLRRVQGGNTKFSEKHPTEQRIAPREMYVESEDYFRGHPSMFRQVEREFVPPHNHVAGGAPYFDRYHEPFAPHHISDVTSHGYHNSIHGSNYVPRYEDPLESQMFRRPSQRIQDRHHQYTSHEIDHFESHPYDTSLCHRSCSCYRCYDRQQDVSPQVLPSAFSNRQFHHVSTKSDPYHHEQEISPKNPPSAFSNRKFHHVPTKSDPYHHEQEISPKVPSSSFSNRKFHHVPTKSDPYHHEQEVSPQNPSSSFSNRKFHHVPTKSDPYHHERHGSFGSHGSNSRLSNTPPSGSNKPPSHTRWPSDLSLDRNSRARPQRAVLSKGHHYRPIASGAPFVTCRNCFELLKLPKKVCIKMGEWQMTCAACSSVISFAFVDEKLTSVDPSAKQTNPEINDSVNDGYLKRDNVSYCSEDYANAGFDFHAMDRDQSFSSTSHHSLSSRKSDETHNIQSVSYTTSEDELSADPPEKSDDSSPPPGSPPHDPFEQTSKYRAVNECDVGSLSSRSDQNKVMTIKNTLEKFSVKDSLATEMELSPDDYANTRLSKDTSQKSREDDEIKGKKGDSFFAGFLKKSFRSNQSIESMKKNVTVNGHLIPDKLVKKAEKLAGPVHPGQYWYDYRAGFWGVVGGPCLGIIPSSIEVFNYPMPEECAAGNTGVFVNGRELHQRDLELLSSRGLPSSTDKSYIVDICGRVVDEDAGEELVSLGKLAPTIEKVKHGFGMRPLKTVA
ncbi:hypothetical protein RND81_03G219600 [Saponaria officinalis]|uniref:Zinc-ribbon domain-containing protein n=1 Tax=Saponaria officinalis TaxID=3572 RepID=A0AAW1M9S4_SAPOF